MKALLAVLLVRFSRRNVTAFAASGIAVSSQLPIAAFRARRGWISATDPAKVI